MDRAIGLCLDKLFNNFMRYGISYGIKAVNFKRLITESFDVLINHLKDMMVGYETDEVQVLLIEMEEVVADVDWYRFEETVMGQILDNVQPLVRNVWDKEDWFRYEERVACYMQAMVKEMENRQAWYRVEKTRLDKILVICERLCNIRYNSNAEGKEVVVGFDDEVKTLLDQLTRSCTEQFQIISIAGMAGLGKTTLARRLYSHPLVEYTFDIRAWTCVSQVYVKKDLLLEILGSFIDGLTDEFYEMSEQQLGETLYRKLKGRKYLVVLDDIWDYGIWNDLKMYFPDDKTGSRVLFTTHDIDVSLHVQSAKPAHVLRLRTEDESWEIFVKKIFRFGILPFELEVLGKVINRKCEGLPLAIVIAAGLLKNNWSLAWWEQIANSLASYIVSDTSQYMESLALSYNHLPPHLRSCFLFFGAFPEDYEVPVRKLIWLWIAKGFIDEAGSRILEDVAEDFLNDLIKRSLLMTARIRADGQVKTCRIHDLLRDFTLKKLEEEDFISNIHRYGMVSSMLCSPMEVGKVLQEGGSIFNETYKSLRILDVESVPVSSFPSDVAQFVNLRYLSIQAHDGSPQASISELVNLQTLIISSRKNIVIPKSIWKMTNLRHLYIKSGENLIEEPCFVQLTENSSSPSGLASLQTLSQVSPQSCKNLFSKSLNLRKLGFCGPLISRLGELEFPNLGSLEHLTKLTLFNTFPYPEATRSCNPIMFPKNLKKLTLSNTGMNWEEIWTFSLLPNLEILKLKFQACIGESWDSGDGEFRQLKVLKLHDLDMRQWVSSKDNFPRLQRLVVHRCLKLNCIPAALGKILTLEVIEVNGCSLSAYKSAVEIQEEQKSEGDAFLKVHGKGNVHSLFQPMKRIKR